MKRSHFLADGTPPRRNWVWLMGVALLAVFGFALGAAQLQFLVPDDMRSLQTVATCRVCHERIYSEWSTSQHARTGPKADPIMAGVYDWLQRQNKKTDGCDVCHAPLQTIAKAVGQGGATQEEGVTCILCHSNAGVHDPGGLGVHHYRYDFVTAINAGTRHEPEDKNKHATQHLEIFKKVDVCVGCHYENGRNDYVPQTSGGGSSCQQCHMPTKKNQTLANDSYVRGRVFRHLFEGGHSEEVLSSAATVEGDAIVSGKDTVLDVTIESAAQHVIPTGFPLRTIYLKAEAFNARKEMVWKNYNDSGIVTDDNARFELRFAATDGLRAHHMDPVTQLLDNRIPAKGVRKLQYRIPVQGVRMIRLTLNYRLVTEAAMAIMALPEGIAPERLIADKQIDLN